MVETGATPKISGVRRRTLRALRAMTTPLLPDDYLALINPRWSTRELRPDLVIRRRRRPRTPRTIVVKPTSTWPAHQPGQYLRIGMEVNGVRQWRAYSITSDPEPPRGRRQHHRQAQPTAARCRRCSAPSVRAGPAGVPRRRRGRVPACPIRCRTRCCSSRPVSGITPIWSMLRDLERREASSTTRSTCTARVPPTTSSSARCCGGWPSGRTATGCTRSTPRDGPRFSAEALDEMCPDWRERELFVSGPRDLIDDAREARVRTRRRQDHFHSERFQPRHRRRRRRRRAAAPCTSASPTATRSATPGESDPRRRRERRRDAPVRLPDGHLPHLCRTAAQDGAVRDLRTGAITRGQRPDDPHLHQRPGGARRDRTLTAIGRRSPLRKATTMPYDDDQPPAAPPDARAARGDRHGVRQASTTRSSPTSATRDATLHPQHDPVPPPARRAVADRADGLAVTSRPGCSGPPACRWPRSSRTWRSATTSCTASGTG